MVRDGWLVRWSATDRDSDTRHATVDYSADGGRTVCDGPSRGRTVVPSTVLQRSARARIRANVSDGFAGRGGRLRATLPAGRVVLRPGPSAGRSR